MKSFRYLARIGALLISISLVVGYVLFKTSNTNIQSMNTRLDLDPKDHTTQAASNTQADKTEETKDSAQQHLTIDPLDFIRIEAPQNLTEGERAILSFEFSNNLRDQILKDVEVGVLILGPLKPLRASLSPAGPQFIHKKSEGVSAISWKLESLHPQQKLTKQILVKAHGAAGQAKIAVRVFIPYDEHRLDEVYKSRGLEALSSPFGPDAQELGFINISAAPEMTELANIPDAPSISLFADDPSTFIFTSAAAEARFQFSRSLDRGLSWNDLCTWLLMKGEVESCQQFEGACWTSGPASPLCGQFIKTLPTN